MNNHSKLVELEFNEQFGGAVTDYWWVFVIVIVIIGAIVGVLMMNKGSSNDENDDGTLENSSNVSKSSTSVSGENIGFRTNEAGEREYYKIVDGEEQELTEEDYKNLEATQKRTQEAVDSLKNTSYGSIAGINIDQIVADSTTNADVAAGATATSS